MELIRLGRRQKTTKTLRGVFVCVEIRQNKRTKLIMDYYVINLRGQRVTHNLQAFNLCTFSFMHLAI